jgi:hypothetical protein
VSRFASTPSPARKRLLLAFAAGAALVVAGGAVLFRERAGTQHLPIHVAAILLTAMYWLFAKLVHSPVPLHSLGLGRPRYSNWLWGLLLLGVAAGIFRFAVYRATGAGGVALYEREFAPLLVGETPGALLVKYLAFLAALYLAVLIPGLLFCGVVQGTFSAANLFLVGLFLQSVTFGLVHCYMPGHFDAVYGAEALVGAVIYGVAFAYLGDLYLPAVFMTTSVFASTVMLLAVP